VTGGMDIYIHIFLTSALVGGGQSTAALLTGKKSPVDSG
jgi:hypothetical protein